MPEEDYDRIAERHEEEADDLERQGDKLDEQIREAKDDWESKKKDESVPGAQEDDED